MFLNVYLPISLAALSLSSTRRSNSLRLILEPQRASLRQPFSVTWALLRISFVYFVVSWAAVNTVIVLSSNRAFREVWNLNTRGVFVYDIGRKRDSRFSCLAVHTI